MSDFDIIMFGSAVVDFTYEVKDTFLTQHNLTKGDEAPITQELNQALSQLSPIAVSPGGSLANTAYALSALGAKVFYLGPAGDDMAGQEFYTSMINAGVTMQKPIKGTKTQVIHCLITPDGERTMVSDEVANPITDDMIDKHFELITTTKNFMVEGYMFLDVPYMIPTMFDMVRDYGINTILTLAAPSVIERKQELLTQIICGGVGLIIANEHEKDVLLKASHNNIELAQAIEKSAHLITHGAKGAQYIFDCNRQECFVKSTPLPVKDATGAGDGFAGGFLYGYLNNFAPEASITLGHALGGAIIQQQGARLPLPLYQQLLDKVTSA